MDIFIVNELPGIPFQQRGRCLFGKNLSKQIPDILHPGGTHMGGVGITGHRKSKASVYQLISQSFFIRSQKEDIIESG
jgi:hypothetical protein